jgi:hypothetical protein
MIHDSQTHESAGTLRAKLGARSRQAKGSKRKESAAGGNIEKEKKRERKGENEKGGEEASGEG